MATLDLLKIIRRRTFLSETVYIILNIFFAVVIAIVMRTTASLWLALLLVLISKWRVLAVRFRYWLANIQANLVDVAVSVAVVLSLYSIELTSLTDLKKWFLAGVVTVLYVAWLLMLKPRSTRRAMAWQAGIALFFATSVLFVFDYAWPAWGVVAAMWVIGYATARHVLSTYDEDRITLLSLAFAFVMAEIGWVGYHWVVGYEIPFLQGLMVPQISLIVILLAFVVQRAYDSFFHYQKIRSVDVLLPILLLIAVTLVLLVFFGQLGTTI